jgi:intein-encoded DNA endonuclease-like protein
LPVSPVPRAGTPRSGERRAREISERKEETVQTENGQQQGESSSEQKEEVQIEGKKRGPYLPRELRIKIYNDVIALRQQGRSYNEIRMIIKQKYGVWIPVSTISGWLSGKRDPRNGRRISSLEMLEPSEDLAHVIGMCLGDGSAWEARRVRKGYREAVISLGAKDKEFVEESARRIARVLGYRPPKVYFDACTGKYYFKIRSKTLYELLKKPIDLKKLRKYIEHCPKCVATCLRAFFDSEGSIDDGVIIVANSNYRVLKYVQYLLRKFGITAKGPNLLHRRGSIMHIKGKRYIRRRNVYYIYTRARDVLKFYKYIGFTIKRKQERLEEYIKRINRRPPPPPTISQTNPLRHDSNLINN